MRVAPTPEQAEEAETANVAALPLRRGVSADVALAPLLLGLAVAMVVPAAASGVSSARALAGLAIGALAALAFARDPFAADRHTRRGVAIVVGLALLYLVSRAWAIAPGGSVLEAGRLATFALVVFAGHVALTRASSRWLALAGIAAAALWIAGPEAWRVLREGAPTERLQGSLGYWNATAIVSVTLVPLAAALARLPLRLAALPAGAMLAVAASAAATTASRGALLATAVGLVVLVAASPDRRAWIAAAGIAAAGLAGGVALLAVEQVPGWATMLLVTLASAAAFTVASRRVGSVARDQTAQRTRRMSVPGVLVCIGVAALTAVLGATFVGDAARTDGPARNDSVERLASTDDSLRLSWWRESTELWQEGRIVGQGGAAFEAARAGRSSDFAAHPHSLGLQVLVDVGIVGALVALVAALVLLRATLGAARTPERAVAAAVAAMVFVQAAIDWTFSLPQVMGVAALALAIALPGRSRADQPGGRLPSATPRVLAATLVAIVAASLVALVPFGASLLADQAAADIDSGNLRSAATHARRSMVLQPEFETLQLQITALEIDGRDEDARTALRASRKVWSSRPDGLAFALQRFPDDPRERARIERQLERIAAERSTAPASQPVPTRG